MNLHSSLRGLTLAVGGLLVLAGVALAAGGSSDRADDGTPSPSQTALATFGAVLEAEPTASAGDDLTSPSPSASFDDDPDDDGASPSASATASPEPTFDDVDDDGASPSPSAEELVDDDNSGPGDGDDDDDNSGPGSGDDDDDDSSGPGSGDDEDHDNSGPGSDD